MAVGSIRFAVRTIYRLSPLGSSPTIVQSTSASVRIKITPIWGRRMAKADFENAKSRYPSVFDDADWKTFFST